MIKMIASDMDGTLLDSEMHISQENLEAIRYAESKGVEFVIATGRNRTEAIAPLEEAGIECSMITLNGAEVFDKHGNSIFTAPIVPETTHKVLDILKENGIYFEISTTKGVYSDSKEQRIDKFASHLAEVMPHLTYKMAIAMTVARLEFLPINFVPDLRDLVDRDDMSVLKIIAFHQDGPSILGPTALKLEEMEDLVVSSSGLNNLEINNRAAQKGIAVTEVALDRQIDMSEVMTIGDNLNDLSMIRVGGVSFAMGNAVDEIKETAKYVTTTNLEAGVGRAIRRAIDEDLK